MIWTCIINVNLSVAITLTAISGRSTMRFIDMHLHTTASDGSCSPSEVCQLAIDKGLAAIAITDHDTIDGVSEAISYAKHHNASLPSEVVPNTKENGSAFSSSGDRHITVVPGIEMSAIYHGVEIHILGFYMDYTDPELISRLAAIKQARYDRNEAMCARFRADGIDMTMERLQHGNLDTVVTRAHFARILIADGICRDMNQAFKKYLGKKSKYYIPTPDIPADEAIELINTYGKAAFVAHPLLYGFGYKQIEEMLEELKTCGLAGLEVYHSSNNSYESGKLREIARAHGLLISGGSDFHGAAKPDISVGSGRGGLRITEAVFHDIKNYCQK